MQYEDFRIQYPFTAQHKNFGILGHMVWWKMWTTLTRNELTNDNAIVIACTDQHVQCILTNFSLSASDVILNDMGKIDKTTTNVTKSKTGTYFCIRWFYFPDTANWYLSVCHSSW